MCLSDDSLSVCQNIEERIDIGVAVLEPSAGKISRYLIDIIYLTSYISNWLLYVLCNCRYKVDGHSELPLLFVQHSWWPVRLLLRFWFPRPKRVPDPAKKSPLAGIVQVCGVEVEGWFSGCDDYVSEWTNSSDISSLLPRNKKDEEADDPSSPYSVNYSGELHTHSQGYSYAIKDENGDKTGYLTFSSPPQSKYNFSVPKGDRRIELETKVRNVLSIMVLLKTLS